MVEDKLKKKNNPLTLRKSYNWTIQKPCNIKSLSLNNNSNMAPVTLITSAAAAVLFLGISHRLSELCCTLEIVRHKKVCQWVGAIWIFKTSFPVFLWGEEHSPRCTRSLWCRLAKLPDRCCHDWYPWIKNGRIREVAQACWVFSPEAWGGTVMFNLDFVAYTLLLCVHIRSHFYQCRWCKMGLGVACLLRSLTWNSWDFFSPLQCMLPRRKALELLSAKSFCWLLSPGAMLILVNSLCEVCVSLGFSYFLATDSLRQYTGLKAKVMAAFPESWN